MKTTHQIIEECAEKATSLYKMVDMRKVELRLAEIDEMMVRGGFWDDQKKAAEITKERSNLTSRRIQIKAIKEETDFLVEYAREFPAEVEGLGKQAEELAGKIGEMEIREILKGENDDCPAIISITSGAGGLESCNYNKMLTRMLFRYCDQRGWKIEILDEKPSEEHSAICQDGITVRVSGEYAYGYLKTLNGVFRLIRNSPFNSGDARHTSFCAISVIPDVDDRIEIEINDKDIDISAIRSSSAGGQAVNKISSCIRLHHIPSGIIIKMQTEASQLQNKKNAFKLLKAKLYDLELKKRENEKDKVMSSLSDNAFGNQSLTITMMPYSLVKCHKTQYESSHVEKYLDGDIHNFILANLYHQVQH